MKSIKLNNEISIDLEKLIQSRMVILANSGGGKSWAIRRIAEQSIDKVQTIIIDPEGEFSSLRENHDLILCGKDADVPVETRSAALLATKLLELNKSAVIDLYELHPQDRQRFVKLFCEALVNAPKNLYHPVLIVLDEAHDYVPEGKPSEATYAVEALASKGRKRGQCLILASQRISKLSKNASAECNNKLIGRASQDIDYMRAGAELGMSKAESAVSLRNLKPGEFFAYGPAISDEIVPLKIGDVKTTHAKVGYKEVGKIPPASQAIKKVLAELKDLPQEAAKEAQTTKELKAQIAELKRHRCPKIEQKSTVSPDIQQKIVEKARKSWEMDLVQQIRPIAKYQAELLNLMKKGLELKQPPMIISPKEIGREVVFTPKIFPSASSFDVKSSASTKIRGTSPDLVIIDDLDGKPTGPEQKVLNAIAWCESIGNNNPPNDLVAFLSGYAHSRSAGYTNPRGQLGAKGFIKYESGTLALTEAGRIHAETPETPLTQEELHSVVLSKLDGPEQKLLRPLLDAYPEGVSNTDLCQMAGYAHERSAGYTNPRGHLGSFGLIEYKNGIAKAKPLLFID